MYKNVGEPKNQKKMFLQEIPSQVYAWKQVAFQPAASCRRPLGDLPGKPWMATTVTYPLKTVIPASSIHRRMSTDLC